MSVAPTDNDRDWQLPTHDLALPSAALANWRRVATHSLTARVRVRLQQESINAVGKAAKKKIPAFQGRCKETQKCKLLVSREVLPVVLRYLVFSVLGRVKLLRGKSFFFSV